MFLFPFQADKIGTDRYHAIRYQHPLLVTARESLLLSFREEEDLVSPLVALPIVFATREV